MFSQPCLRAGVFACLLTAPSWHAATADAEPQGVHLTALQRETAGVVTEIITPRPVNDETRAPGEVRLNAYATVHVTPRIAAQAVERHARLGDAVKKGDPLVTLSSVKMAQAQGELMVTERAWQRMKALGKQAVSGRRHLEAQVTRQQTRARVLAFGMTPEQADALLRDGAEQANGSFQLLAPRDGTVVRDDFIQGEMIAPGRVLFEITDETVLWVEARITPEEASRIPTGSAARVRHGAAWIDGKVVQIFHALDETTRTQAVRIEVPNLEHRLHPGRFVDVRIAVGEGQPVMAVPEEAVLRGPDGDWMIFVAQGPDGFSPVEVQVLRTAGGLAVLKGVAPGTEVVIQGAFFLQSELAKGGFEIHQH